MPPLRPTLDAAATHVLAPYWYSCGHRFSEAPAPVTPTLRQVFASSPVATTQPPAIPPVPATLPHPHALPSPPNQITFATQDPALPAPAIVFPKLAATSAAAPAATTTCPAGRTSPAVTAAPAAASTFPAASPVTATACDSTAAHATALSVGGAAIASNATTATEGPFPTEATTVAKAVA